MLYYTYSNLTLEFLSSFDVDRGVNGIVTHVFFRLLNNDYNINLPDFGKLFWLSARGEVSIPDGLNPGSL